MTATHSQKVFSNTEDVDMMGTNDVDMVDIDHLPTQPPTHLPTIRTLPEKAVWKGAMPPTHPISPQSKWAIITIHPSEAVVPYHADPRRANNGVEVSLRADAEAGDPLLTAYSIDTWIGTMFMTMSRIMGKPKWMHYKNLVHHILFNSYEPSWDDEVDPRAVGSLLDFFAWPENRRIAYLHNDLARQLTYLPVFKELGPVDEETLRLMRRISVDWERELEVVKGQPFSTNGGRVGRDDEEDFLMDACQVALEFLQKWKSNMPTRGRSVPTLLSAFGSMSV
ncbi:hypothetical protein P171DRAFT_439756 [Karstenula rhodostoma CBS 690.94]|uniref:Uncharacterized protein n=1 Tax=Karstenula rhodostoma CBS 690.94 TaxID=1392251 RepID=A0A9P4UHE3_9PLEO|nr:hypothetical protein P171DRAFT_439756 [Karstenula rhodostoma CBS 690.94]